MTTEQRVRSARRRSVVGLACILWAVALVLFELIGGAIHGDQPDVHLERLTPPIVIPADAP